MPLHKDIDVLGVGTLNPFKQYDVFINVVKELSASFPGIKAVICGEGTERPRLERMIRESGMENNISMTGLIPHSDVLKWMKRSKLFLHPSSYEGFGSVCLEALFAGAHVISFCDPMLVKTERWHIAKKADDMRTRAFEILKGYDGVSKSVLLYSMNDTATAVVNLFEK